MSGEPLFSEIGARWIREDCFGVRYHRVTYLAPRALTSARDEAYVSLVEWQDRAFGGDCADSGARARRRASAAIGTPRVRAG